MPKKKVDEIKNPEQLNDVMLAYAKATADIEKINATYQPKIDKLTEKREKRVSPISEIKDTLQVKIENYVKENRSSLMPEGTKTITTPYGTISFKFTKEKVVFASEEVVIKTMKQHWFKWFTSKHYRAAVKVEEKIVKENLKQLSEIELKELGVELKSEERIYINPDLEVLIKKQKRVAAAV